MAPSYTCTSSTINVYERGYSFSSTTSGYLRSCDTSIDYEYTYTKSDEVKVAEWVKYYMWIENKRESIDSVQALARMKRRIEDVCARQFIYRAIRQPKPKSNLRAKLYK